MSLISTMFDCACDVKRPTVGQDANSGTTSDPFVFVRRNLPCSYQESNAFVDTVYGQRNTLLASTVFFAQDPGTEVNDVLAVRCPRTKENFNVLVLGEAQPVMRGRMYGVSVKRIREPK